MQEADVEKMSKAEREDAVNEIRLLASIKYVIAKIYNPLFYTYFINDAWSDNIIHLLMYRHVNICRYHEAFLDGNYLCIVMSFAPSGDLALWISRAKERKKVQRPQIGPQHPRNFVSQTCSSTYHVEASSMQSSWTALYIEPQLTSEPYHHRSARLVLPMQSQLLFYATLAQAMPEDIIWKYLTGPLYTS